VSGGVVSCIIFLGTI